MGKQGAGQKAVTNPSETPGGLDQVQELLASLGDATGLQVLLYELLPTGSAAILGTLAAGEFDPFAFAEDYGAGRYRAVVKDVVGKKFRGQRDFEVSRHVVGKRNKPGGATPATPAAAAGTDKSDRLFELMIAMMQAQSAQTGAMLAAAIAKPDKDPLASVMPLLVAREENKKPAGGLGEVIDALSKLDSMRGQGELPDSGGGGDKWTALIPAVLAGVKALAGDGAPAQQQQRPRPPMRLVRVKSNEPATPAQPAQSDTTPAPGSPDPGSSETQAQPPAPPRDDPPATAAGDDDGASVTLAALAEQLVGHVALNDNHLNAAEFAKRVLDVMDTDALGELMDTIPSGELGSTVGKILPAAVAALLPQHEEQFTELERLLREDLAELDADDGGGAS